MADTTTSCTSEQDLYKDVKYCKGQKNNPGLRSYAYFIKRSNVVTFPTKKGSAATTLEEIAKLVGDFVLAADKKWSKIELIPDKNNFSIDSVGQFPTKVFKNTVTIIVPGTNEEVTGLAAQLNNDDCLFLVPTRNGKFRLVGNEEYNCDVKPKLESGSGAEDANSTSMEITVNDDIPCPFYPGKIATNEGDISGADGKAIVVTP